MVASPWANDCKFLSVTRNLAELYCQRFFSRKASFLMPLASSFPPAARRCRCLARSSCVGLRATCFSAVRCAASARKRNNAFIVQTQERLPSIVAEPVWKPRWAHKLRVCLKTAPDPRAQRRRRRYRRGRRRRSWRCSRRSRRIRRQEQMPQLRASLRRTLTRTWTWTGRRVRALR